MWLRKPFLEKQVEKDDDSASARISKRFWEIEFKSYLPLNNEQH